MRDITMINLERWINWRYCLKTRSVSCYELGMETTTSSSGVSEVVSVLVSTLRPPPTPVCLLGHKVEAMLIRISWCVSSQIN